MPSDSGMTPAEQAALDADKAAEVQEETTPQPAAEAPEAGVEGDGAAAVETGQEQPPRQGTVPHAVMHEERRARQEAERALAEERKARAMLEERTNIMLQRFSAPQQPAPAQNMPEIPAFDQDPAGHILGKMHQQGAILSELVQAVTGQHRQNEAVNAAADIKNRADALEREYAAANPGYAKAADYLFNAVRQELMISGVTDPGQLQKQMGEQAFILAATALRQGRNPAEMALKYAEARGYKEAEAPVPNNDDASASEGQLQTIAAGQQQSRSGGLRGSGPVPLTATRLAEMSDSEFLKMMDTPEGRALMGS